MKYILALTCLLLISCTSKDKTPNDYSPEKYDKLKQECLNTALMVDDFAENELYWDLNQYVCRVIAKNYSVYYFDENEISAIYRLSIIKDKIEKENSK